MWRRTFGSWLVSAFSARGSREETGANPTLPWEANPAQSSGRASIERLDEARSAFESMLDGIPTERVAADMPSLPVELRLSIGLPDLWALRPALFEQAARHFDQSEAARRLAALDRRYPPPRPRSASPRAGLREGRKPAGRVAGITGSAQR